MAGAYASDLNVCMYVWDYVCDYVDISCLIIVYVSPAVCMFQDQRIAPMSGMV